MTPHHTITIHLSDDQRHILQRFLSAGTHPSRLLVRARILLKADADGPDAWSDEEVAEHLETSRMTVQRVRQQFAAEGLDATLHRKKPTGRRSASSTASRKHDWSRWRVRKPRKDAPVGRWCCWPTGWWG
jgi:biotin operon repressor